MEHIMRIILYGSGTKGTQVYDLLRKGGTPPIGFFDSNPELFGSEKCGVPVLDIEKTPRESYDKIIITSAFKDQIAARLIQTGFHYGEDFEYADGEPLFAECLRAFEAYRNMQLALTYFPGWDYHEKSILHLGCGDMIVLDLLHLMSGAKKVLAIDPRPMPGYPDITTSVNNMIHVFNEFKKNPEDFREQIVEFKDPKHELLRFVHRNQDTYYVNYDYSQFYPFSGEILPFSDNLIDLTHSNAVFEHITDPEKTISELYRITTSGGLTLHCIDLRDHVDNNAPYTHLSCSEEGWKTRAFNDAGCFRTNRWRGTDYVQTFQEYGFDVVHYELFYPEPEILETFPKHIDPAFERYTIEELKAMSCLVYARKP
jgi:SAM-dependent methyltransferase